MKKFLSLLVLFVSVFPVLAYTSTDVSNATFLATEGIIVKQSSASGYRFDNTITRAEVMGIALKMKGIVLPNYQCKGYYTDVRNNDWICRAVELAADNGIISRANAKARPQDVITRAEALGIFIKSIGDTGDYECTGCGIISIDSSVGWHRDVFLNAWSNYGIQPIKKEYLGGQELDSKYMYYFEPSRFATRAEVFGFARNILGGEKSTNSQMSCKIDGVEIYGDCLIDHGDIRYGKYIETTTYGDNFFQGLECGISYESQGDYIIGSPKPGKYGETEYIDMSYLENGLRIVLGHNGYYEISSFGNIDNCMNVLFLDVRKLTAKDVLKIYYGNLDKNTIMGMKEWAYRMRSPAGVSLETFQSWYKNVTSVVFREDTSKDLGDNTYEFLVEMVENGTKSTYKVKSKVDLANFKIDNISSVKQ